MIDGMERVELHCHTKVGGNSTMYPGEIIKYLSEMDMPAVAITDESNINAYPELEMVWKTGNYSTRPIYGMEIWVKGKKAKEVDRISLLVQNETGKKELYRIISENTSEEPNPVFSFEVFRRNRTNFLIGSGTVNGPIYKGLLSGMDDEELKRQMAKFDYIELLPGKEFEIYTRRILRLCEVMGIPAVAVSDARYKDKIGKRALTIMRHWNKDSEDVQHNYLMSTKEMLEAFYYLDERKAWEIVVRNTNLIADMCCTFPICPRERCYPKVQNAGIRLRENCYRVLNEKYPDRLDEARERLEWELEALEKTDMESYPLQVAELLTMSRLGPDNISMRGVAAGSIVAYLLGISNVDPIKYGLEAEEIFGNNMQREIDIDLNIPSERQLDVIKSLDVIEGIGKYVWAGSRRHISSALAQVMIEKYIQDKECYFEEEELEKLIWSIEGNNIGIGKHPGGILLFPSDCEYLDMLPIARVEGGVEVSYFDYHYVDQAFIKLDILKHDTPEALGKLERLTGVRLDTVPVNSPEVLSLFKADEQGNLTGIERLPEFNNDFMKMLVKELRPETIEELAKITAIAHGTDTWLDNGEILVKEQEIDIRHIIATRDDVFEFNRRLGLDRETAFEISEAVRKGIVSRGRNSKWQNWKRMLIEADAPEWYIWSCEQIKYLFPRSHAISYTIMNMRLGWFKVHYPKAFELVMKEYEDRI